MLGSSASISDTNTMLNTMVADVFSRFADRIEAAEDRESEIIAVIRDAVHEHKRIIFNGDGYSNEWQEEAARRGLHNLRSTVDAIPTLKNSENVSMFERHGVLSRTEINSRVDIALENYSKIIHIEALTLIEMISRDVIPAISSYCDCLCRAVSDKRAVIEDINCSMELTLINKLSDINVQLFELLDKLSDAVSRAEKNSGIYESARLYRNEVLQYMQNIRYLADTAESITDRKLWPYPGYGDLLFKI